ncbi:MAG: HDIG domain-containing protein [Bacteriovoracaceae bacterium]|nr:HDIG domain-containing protein [Bacteriovoracaceae bacterium]
MQQKVPNRQEAFELLCQYTKSKSLKQHALAVEGVMRYFANKYGEDVEKWGVIGLIHDLDYEQYPQEHCQHTPNILKEHNWPQEYIRAVISHGFGVCSDVEPITKLEKTLYAIDELTGLVATTALVRPSKNVNDVKVKSVKKKWKDKRFAAGVDRSIIENGAKMLEVELPSLIEDTIKGMQQVAAQIGLAGQS